MKLVADTGALLSLACSQHFVAIKKEHEIIIPSSVHQELSQFAAYDDFLGKKAQELLKCNLPIINPKKITDIGLEKAESEVFSLAKEKNLLALTDDIHAARKAVEQLNLPTRPSFYLLLLLYKENKLKKEELIADIQHILKHRNWLEGALWAYALRMIEEIK